MRESDEKTRFHFPFSIFHFSSVIEETGLNQ
jgi:hypothetical protein